MEEILKPVLPKEVDRQRHQVPHQPDRPLRGRWAGRRLRPDWPQDHRRYLRRLRPHGGGAFSGKDPTKVDRSAAYAVRYVAKNLVAAGLARPLRSAGVLRHRRGRADLIIMVETFGTGKVSRRAARRSWCAGTSICALRASREMLDLVRPIYQKTAAYGHFGRTEPSSAGRRRTRPRLSRPN